MLKKLSKREQVLVWVLICLMVFYVSFSFVLIPIYRQAAEKSDQISQLQLEKESVEQKLKSRPGLEESFQTIKKEYDKNQALFVDTLSNEELDKLITGLCLEQGLKPTSLGMTIIKKEILPDVPAVTETPEVPLDDQATTSETEVDATLPQEAEKSVISMTTAAVTVQGEYDKLQKLIDKVNQTSYVTIKTVTFVFADTAEILPANATNQQTADIVFEVYMKDVSSVSLNESKN